MRKAVATPIPPYCFQGNQKTPRGLNAFLCPLPITDSWKSLPLGDASLFLPFLKGIMPLPSLGCFGIGLLHVDPWPLLLCLIFSEPYIMRKRWQVKSCQCWHSDAILLPLLLDLFFLPKALFQCLLLMNQMFSASEPHHAPA